MATVVRCVLFVFAFGLAGMAVSAQPFTNEQQAEAVYGQGGLFTSKEEGVSNVMFGEPHAVTLDAEGRMYVADYINHRILRFDDPLNLDTADAVYGQQGVFTANAFQPVSARSMREPSDLAFDNEGRLYVVDGNQRILRFDHPLTSDVADAVYGQPDFVSSDWNRGAEPSDSSLLYPKGICFDADGRMYVADASNNRVLRFDDPLHSSVANAVYGQPNMTSRVINSGGRSASSMSYPSGVALDKAGRLYVADQVNSRVLRFDDPLHSPVADAVYGQSDFTTTTVVMVGATTMYLPTRVAIDGYGRLYVCDAANNRVLIFNDPLNSSAADVVLGQSDMISRKIRTSQSGLNAPVGICFDGARGKLYLADALNRRVLRYATIGGIPLGVESGDSTETRMGGLDLR